MAFPASYILNKIGCSHGMALGLSIMALGALVFIPAAEAKTYWVFLAGIFIQGIGMTILQTAANPYIAILAQLKIEPSVSPLWLGILALFVYVGAEVIAGDTIIAYGI